MAHDRDHEGEVVECSREKNSELFQYSLAGWGRVGIIVKFRVSVEKSKHGLVAGGAFFHSPADFFASYQKLAAHPDIDLLSCQIQFSHHGFLDMPWAAPFRIGFGYEAADERDALEKSERVRDALRHDIHFFGHVENDANVTFTMTPVLNPKHYAVYVFPEEEATVGELSHIWHDYLLPRERFMDFVTWSRDAVREHGLQETFLRQPFFHSLIHVDMCGGYSFKHLEGTYPLVPEIRAEDTHTWHINYSHNVPRASIPSVIGFVDEASTRCYRDGGKRYLYGTHRLGRDQVVAQYGLETIHAWNGIKKQTDPKLLMNRGVIPHLDEML